MKILIITVLMLTGISFADVEVDTWIMPIKVYYADQTSELVWIEHSPNGFYYQNRETIGFDTRPLPGKNVLFLNKFGSSTTLRASEKLYKLSDGYECLIATKKIALDKAILVEIVVTDSLQPIGIWGSRFVDGAGATALLEKKPLFTDLIVTEQDAAYNAQHVYCFDAAFTKKQIRTLFEKDGLNSPQLKKAIEEGRVVFVEEVTP